MNNLVKAAALSEDAAAGREVTFSTDGKDKFRVIIVPGGAHNNRLAELIEAEFRPFRQAGIDANDIDVNKQREITARCYTKAVVKGWNAEDFGEEYSEEACIRTMLQAPTFMQFIVNQSGQEKLFRDRAVKAAEGN